MYYNKILNTIIPGYMDEAYRIALEKRYHGAKEDERYIEVQNELTYLMNSTLFRLGPGKFMGMLQKGNSKKKDSKK